MRIIVAVLIVGLALISLSASEHYLPNGGLPIVKTDYRRCVMIHNGPLVRPRMFNDNRPGQRSEIA